MKKDLYIMNSRILIIVSFLLFSVFANGEEKEDKKRDLYTYLSGGLGNYDSWNIDIGGGYRPIHYFSVGAGLRISDTYGDDSPASTGTTNNRHLWTVDNVSDFAYHFAFQPDIRIYSPNIKIETLGDNLNFSIGYGLTIPLTNKAKGTVSYMPMVNGNASVDRVETVRNKTCDRNVYQFINVSANIESSVWIFSTGFRFSNYDVFGSARQVYLEGSHIEFQKRTANNEFYIMVTYKL